MVDKDNELKENYIGKLRSNETKKTRSIVASNSKASFSNLSLNLLENCLNISKFTPINIDDHSNVINLTESFFKFTNTAVTAICSESEIKSIDKKSKKYSDAVSLLEKQLSSLISLYNLKNRSKISLSFGSKIDNKLFTEFYIIKLKQFINNIDSFTFEDALYFNRIDKSLIISSINFIFQKPNSNIVKLFKIDILIGLTDANTQFTKVKDFNELLEIKDIKSSDEIKSNKKYLNILTSKAATSAYLHFVNTANKNKKEPYEIKTIIDAVTKCFSEANYYNAPFNESLYGLTIFDKSMILNKFHLNDLKGTWSSECIILMTLVHEIAHFIKRILVDSNFFNDTNFFDGNMKVNESGDYIDGLLISNTTTLSSEGAKYYMNVENWNCDYDTFRQQFLTENTKNSDTKHTFKFKKGQDDKRLCLIHMH